MIELEKAISVINTVFTELPAEEIPVLQSLRRVLASDVISDTDMPPFNKAAMDGFACRISDLDDILVIVDEIPAGKYSRTILEKGQCARIMTGAPLPGGADYVLMKEHAQFTGRDTIKRIQSSGGSNICYTGEDVKAGDIILEKGTRILPQHIAMMATAGCMHPIVRRLPEVAILSTGSELVHPSVKPEDGKIRNSNGFQIAAQILEYGIAATDLGIVPDDRHILAETLSNAINKFDLIIISGGVSVGDYDYVPGVLEDLLVETLFRGLKIKPGKHMLLGRKQNHFVAAMPGNPVSAFVLFEIIIKPLLNRLIGFNKDGRRMLLRFGSEYVTKNRDLLLFLPVRITKTGWVEPVEYHGSAHIHSYTFADGMMEIPPGSGKIERGEEVYVRPL